MPIKDFMRRIASERALSTVYTIFLMKGGPLVLVNIRMILIGFGEQVLGETFTDEVKVLMESVRDNPVTIAQSSNAVGKTHAAARIAVWWFKCFPDSQIYTAAAPPESNLKKAALG